MAIAVEMPEFVIPTLLLAGLLPAFKLREGLHQKGFNTTRTWAFSEQVGSVPCPGTDSGH